MSWIQSLYTTYERCAGAIGIISGDKQDKMLLPIGHALKKTDLSIHLRSDGTFDRAVKSDVEICAPCTDESESRTSGAANSPHPLFDQIKHLTGKVYLSNLVKWRDYLAQLQDHATAHEMLSAVCKYITGGTLNKDLETSGIKPEDKLFVRFCVSIDGESEDRLWMMREIWHAWNSYYQSAVLAVRKTKDLCYISGQNDTTYTEKHPKSINRAAGNAKLITGNDSSNFVFRGKFTGSAQAVTVSYDTSQKAHQALRWLIVNQGYRCDTQAIVAWAIDEIPSVPDFFVDSCGIYDAEIQTDADKLIEVGTTTFIDYAKWMNTALLSAGNLTRLKVHTRRIAVLATDAATTGRMAVTYYRELGENEYLERVVKWHNTCNWYQPSGKDKDGRYKPGYFIGAPSFDRIINAVLGKRRKQKDDAYDKLIKTARERLLHCVFDGERVPRDMVRAAVHRASNPLTLEKTDAKSATDRWRSWEEALCATCALVKRHHYDLEEEEFKVALEGQRTDRDYLYGRLLAVADRIESAARYKQGTARDDARATNAMRYMTVFSQRPFRTWNMLFTQQLNPYIQQLNGAGWYLKQIEDIMTQFKEGEYETDIPLSGKYLLGFFAQRQTLRQGKE